MPELESYAAKLLVALGGGAVLYAYWHAIIENRTALRLIRWLRVHHPQVWNEQPRLTRNLNRLGALGDIARAGAVDAPTFRELYAKAATHRHRKIVALAVGVPLLVLAGLGLKLWGWEL